MQLLVDVGNTRIKWAWRRGGQLRDTGSFMHREQALPELPTAWRRYRGRPSRVIFCNVAGPELGAKVMEWVERLWTLKAEQVFTTAAAFGVTNGYQVPEQLGVDRWMAMVAVRHASPGFACIADCGSALTVDALDTAGQHLGGLILPGLQLMMDVLVQGTHGVQVEPGVVVDSVLARSTYGGVLGGSHYALVATLDRVADELEQTFSGPIRRIITGGDGERLEPLLARRWEWRPHLVLEGLAVMAAVEQEVLA